MAAESSRGAASLSTYPLESWRNRAFNPNATEERQTVPRKQGNLPRTMRPVGSRQPKFRHSKQFAQDQSQERSPWAESCKFLLKRQLRQSSSYMAGGAALCQAENTRRIGSRRVVLMELERDVLTGALWGARSAKEASQEMRLVAHRRENKTPGEEIREAPRKMS